MPWYNQGTVDVTANSDTVTGTGTAFSANARVGDAFIGPDLGLYEVTNIASATVLSIRPNYQGATASGQSYAIAPMQGYVKESADRLRQLTDLIGGSPWLQATTPEEVRETLGAAPLASPAFTGDPKAPTPAATDNDTSIANTEFVRLAMALFGIGALSPKPTTALNELAETGLFSFEIAATNRPFDYGLVLHLSRGAQDAVQIAVRRVSSQWMSFRYKQAGVWSEWADIWHSKNLIKQTGPLDSTAGALMAVGAFGLGADAIVLSAPDLNLNRPGGFYYCSGAINGPSIKFAVSNYGWLEHTSTTGGTYFKQKFTVYGQVPRYFERIKYGPNVWTEWREIYTNVSIVAPVFMDAGGLPAGGIIERGSNANGEYVRFADGTQICTALSSDVDVPISVAFFGGFRSSGFGWTYPSPFIQLHDAQGTPRSSAHAFSLNVGGSTEAATYLYTAISSQPSANRECYLFAIGRWY